MDWTLISSFAGALFAIINPFGNLPIFVSYTAGESKEVQRWLALFVSLTVLVFLLIFLLFGSTILKFLVSVWRHFGLLAEFCCCSPELVWSGAA